MRSLRSKRGCGSQVGPHRPMKVATSAWSVRATHSVGRSSMRPPAPGSTRNCSCACIDES